MTSCARLIGLRLAGAATLFALLTVVFAPQAGTGCIDPSLETSPDGRWTLSLCPRATWFAMPGQGGDAPAWIVLHDRAGWMRGLSELDMVQSYHVAGLPTVWRPDAVEVPMVAVLALPRQQGAAWRWLGERIWRLRALLRLTPTSDMFH